MNVAVKVLSLYLLANPHYLQIFIGNFSPIFYCYTIGEKLHFYLLIFIKNIFRYIFISFYFWIILHFSIILRYWFLYSIRDIADMYGERESKIKALLFRMRNELKKLLEKEDIYL